MSSGPQPVVVTTEEEVFFHCGKALLRSRLGTRPRGGPSYADRLY